MWAWLSPSKEGEQSLLEDVENSTEKQSQCEEDEQFICQLPAVVLGDELPPELDGPCHGLELVIGLLDGPGGGCLKQQRKVL